MTQEKIFVYDMNRKPILLDSHTHFDQIQVIKRSHSSTETPVDRIEGLISSPDQNIRSVYNLWTTNWLLSSSQRHCSNSPHYTSSLFYPLSKTTVGSFCGRRTGTSVFNREKGLTTRRRDMGVVPTEIDFLNGRRDGKQSTVRQYRSISFPKLENLGVNTVVILSLLCLQIVISLILLFTLL